MRVVIPVIISIVIFAACTASGDPPGATNDSADKTSTPNGQDGNQNGEPSIDVTENSNGNDDDSPMPDESNDDLVDSNTPTIESAPDTSPVNAREVYQAYETNGLGAEATYGGSDLTVVGSVSEVDRDFLGNAYVVLGSGDLFGFGIQGYVSESEVTALGALSIGDEIEVTGRVSGYLFNVEMDPCSLVI